MYSDAAAADEEYKKERTPKGISGLHGICLGIQLTAVLLSSQDGELSRAKQSVMIYLADSLCDELAFILLIE